MVYGSNHLVVSLRPSSGFTPINKQAIGSLCAMNYNYDNDLYSCDTYTFMWS